MYEPARKVGIFHQRPSNSEGEQNDRLNELLDRSSLHAVDSFFNVMRQRVSFFNRAGLQRSSGSHYNIFQPYRPDMVQKIVDISRVWFNWVEPRDFRISRRFKGKIAKDHSSSTEMFEKLSDENERQEKREAKSTPAMRMFWAKRPIPLEEILYIDWRSQLFPVEKAKRPRRGTKAGGQPAANTNAPAPWLKTAAPRR